MASVMLSKRQLLIEEIWQGSITQFSKGINEVSIKASLKETLGHEGLQVIADRFSKVIGGQAVVFLDIEHDAIRMVKPMLGFQDVPFMQGSSQGVNKLSANDSLKVKKAKLGKVPRPPNAFILYRKYHHPAVKAANPDMHNNDISVTLGKKWQNESEATKLYFKKAAADLKSQHARDLPNYEYHPRKTSDKKRRKSTKTVAAKTGTGDAGQSKVGPAYEQYLLEDVPVLPAPGWELVDQGYMQTSLSSEEAHLHALLDEFNNEYKINDPMLVNINAEAVLPTNAVAVRPTGEINTDYFETIKQARTELLSMKVDAEFGQTVESYRDDMQLIGEYLADDALDIDENYHMVNHYPRADEFMWEVDE